MSIDTGFYAFARSLILIFLYSFVNFRVECAKGFTYITIARDDLIPIGMSKFIKQS